jgi:hypothetical protein
MDGKNAIVHSGDGMDQGYRVCPAGTMIFRGFVCSYRQIGWMRTRGCWFLTSCVLGQYEGVHICAGGVGALEPRRLGHCR